MKVNIGKNTLGDSNKMSVALREYERSNHDLSYSWRSSMGVGTLVPCMKLLAMPGDVFNINIRNKVMTHPTIGPLFGSYKLQVDVFTCPIRLYNAQLHNNALNVGLDMSKVKLPKIRPALGTKTNSSSIFNYLGIKYTKANKKINAVPLLAVYDIFKNYYANKQEENFYVIKKANEIFNVGTTGGDTPQCQVQDLVAIVQHEEVRTFNSKGYNAQALVLASSQLIANTVVDLEGNPIQNIRATLDLDQARLKFDTVGNITSITIPQGAGWKLNQTVTQSRVYLRNITIKATYSGDISLEANKLEVLDDIREEILSAGKTEYIIGRNGNCKIDFFNNLINNIGQTDVLFGLPLKTHFSDIFNNWVNKEWVDGDNGISAVTAIDTSGGSFTIDTLNLAQKVYNLLNRIAVSGGSYKDWIETVYTTDYYFRAETPIYEGGMSAEIEFSEVVSTAATDIQNNEALGTLGGKGYNSDSKGGTVSIKVNEPSYIIALASITPRVDYSQGNDWDNDLDTMNDIHKPQLDGIGYQDLMQKWMHGNANEVAAVGKTVAWINYMTNVNKSYGSFAVGESESYMCLNRVYELGTDGEINNTTTYINPKEFTGTFATNELGNMDFWVQLGFGIEARRVMSAKQIPIM